MRFQPKNTLAGQTATTKVQSVAALKSTSKKPTFGCKTLNHDSRVTAKKVIVVHHVGKKHSKRSKRDDGHLWLCHKSSAHHYVRDAGGKGWHANMGYNGAAKKKREGDGKTPKGVFTMKAGFGTSKKPKQFKHGKYTHVTRNYVWVDGKHKKKYNTMQKRSKGYRGESLYQKPAYTYAQVIGYNPKNTPGKGSGIFLHVHTGSGVTAGCVSISKSHLKKVFAWEGNSKVQIKIR